MTGCFLWGDCLSLGCPSIAFHDLLASLSSYGARAPRAGKGYRLVELPVMSFQLA